MAITEEEAKSLYKDIQIAAERAGVRVVKVENNSANVGVKPDMALSIELFKLNKTKEPLDVTCIKFGYKNWRDEFGIRTAIPLRIEFTKTEWHTDIQWILFAYDLDRQAERAFALKDCNFRYGGKE